MKVHMITLAALAAASLSAQGVAQEGDNLQRALADLNDGLTVPAGSSSFDISGDARTRNLWTSSGASKDIDARARLNFLFNVNEQVGANVSVLGFEDWGTQANDKFFAADGDTRIDTRIDQAYFWSSDVFGDGGTITIGRKYFTVGSGRIIGSDDWDQAPMVNTGIWYEHEAGGLNVEAFFLNSQIEADIPIGGGFVIPARNDYMGVTFDWTLETEGAGNFNFSPYLISERDNGLTLEDGWFLGTTIDGEVGGLGWDAEWATQDNGGSALALSTTIGLDALESIPGVEDGGLTLALTSADDDFNVGGDMAVRHAVAGLADILVNGVWTWDTDTLSAHLDFSPSETWNGRISYWDIDNPTMALTDLNEWDFQVGTTLAGAVDLWLGWAHTSTDNAPFDDDIIWVTVGLDF